MGNIDVAADWLRFAKMDLDSARFFPAMSLTGYSALVRYPPASEVTESDAAIAMDDASLVFTACEKAIEYLRSRS